MPSSLALSHIERLPSPEQLLHEYPINDSHCRFIHQTREQISQILTGLDSRMLIIVGPCSIHDPQAAIEYAENFRRLADEVADHLLLVMRVYLEKPRSILGWKGLIHDPYLDGSNDFATGLKIARKLLLKLTDLRVPAATEFLELITPSYLADLISWGCIGARTNASQPHRQLASGLPMPVGFKNGVDGDIAIAIQGALVAKFPHRCVTLDNDGHAALIHTGGNPFGHLVLRGANSFTNYDAHSIEKAVQMLKESELPPHLLVDCSHGNCQKNFSMQKDVFQAVINQRLQGNSSIAGIMLESNLNEGSQAIHHDRSKLHYAISLTDPCINWEDTEKLIRLAHEGLSSSVHIQPLCPSLMTPAIQ